MTTVSGYYQLECEIRQLKEKLKELTTHQTHVSDCPCMGWRELKEILEDK